jgi:hypothetical protein
MHISLEKLLALRDGPPDEIAGEAGLVEHLQSCPECSAEFARLNRLRKDMRSLPPEIPPASAWEAIERKLDAQRRRTRAWWTGGFALAASVVVGIAVWFNLGMNMESAEPQLIPEAMVINTDPLNIATEAGEQTTASTLRFGELPVRTRSQLLEQRLRSMRPESRVLNGRDAMAAAELEDLIALVDYQLGYVRSLDDQRAEQLWQQRVNLMSGLVQVREQGALSRGGVQNASYQQ